MIGRVDEINRVLIVAEELGAAKDSVALALVVEQCRTTVVEGRLPNHEDTVLFCERLGFVERRGDDLSLTQTGNSFLEFNPDRSYDFTEEQRKVLLRTCYLHGPCRHEAHRLLSGFSPAYDEGTFRWSEVDNAPLEAEPWVWEHLLQLGLLSGRPDALVVSLDYSKTVAAFLEEGRGWSEEQFREYLREKLEVGDIAEDLVVKSEAERLLALQCAVESKCIRRVSGLRVNAGYDVESFDSKCEDLNYNRFIEVKGAKGPNLKFFWSENEMQVAKKLGARYWIYFQGGIDVKTRTAKNNPLVFQNPVKTVLGDATFTKIPQGVIVQANLRGEEYGAATRAGPTKR